MKRKIGDTVTIRNDLKIYEKYGANTINEDGKMNKYFGKTAIIKMVCGKYYGLDIDNAFWWWTDEMFEDKLNNKEKYQFKVGDKVELPKIKSINVDNFKIAIGDIKNTMLKEQRRYCIIDNVTNNNEVWVEGWTFAPKDLIPYKEAKNVSSTKYKLFINTSNYFEYIKKDKTKVHIKLDNKTNKPKDCSDNLVRIINDKFKGLTGIVIDGQIQHEEPLELFGKFGYVHLDSIPRYKYIADIRIDDNILHINMEDLENVYKNGTKRILLDDDGRIYMV